jgi:hypothetical protein
VVVPITIKVAEEAAKQNRLNTLKAIREDEAETKRKAQIEVCWAREHICLLKGIWVSCHRFFFNKHKIANLRAIHDKELDIAQGELIRSIILQTMIQLTLFSSFTILC